MTRPKLKLMEILHYATIRESLTYQLDSKKEIASLRQVSSDFLWLTPRLFSTLRVRFDVETFADIKRILALETIAHHVQTLLFTMDHTEATKLPKIIDTTDQSIGMELIYRPASYSSFHEPERSGFVNCEVDNSSQGVYPPLYHAATNVYSFVTAISKMKNLTVLRINCALGNPPNTGRPQRRSSVDYALISLRMALEQRVVEARIKVLGLESIHLCAISELRSNGFGIGVSPGSRQVWSNVTDLSLRIHSWRGGSSSRSGTSKLASGLKILHSFLASFVNKLEYFSFEWENGYCACPLILDKQLGFESLKPLRFQNLKIIKLKNILMEASSVRELLKRHEFSMEKICFQDVVLSRGNWGEALSMRAVEWRGMKGFSGSSGGSSGGCGGRDVSTQPVELNIGGNEGVGGMRNFYIEFEKNQETLVRRSV